MLISLTPFINEQALAYLQNHSPLGVKCIGYHITELAHQSCVSFYHVADDLFGLQSRVGDPINDR